MASNPNYCDVTPEIEALAAMSLENSCIDPEDYVRYDVKRGLRDLNGKGVVAGLTEISDIVAKKLVDGKEIPCDGKLYYRGVDVEELVSRLEENGPRLLDRKKRSVMSSAMVMKEIREHSWTEASWKEIRIA